MSMSNIVFGDGDTSETTFPEGYPDLRAVPSPPTGQDDSYENLEEFNHNLLFGVTPLPTLVDVPMTNQTPQPPKEIDTICNDLQAKLELDPEHLKIATMAAKYYTKAGAKHASSVFAMGAYNQLSATQSLAIVSNHVYNSTFKDEDSNDPPDPKP
ncbi:hypothetical protein PGT21_015249 [Puccinia graminis f. sp. tritici]|uniref:Uncharacterized protein n=1 Tax=Puccinia graminis f. sp. tritici TaxID=56615 RepID=A0A5B0PR27_PUCGR|nr:hypothetical protein PGT21_015249 [Puccinia graminis f. sp. tritici]